MVAEFIDYLDSNFDIQRVSGGAQVKVNGECPFCGEDRADMRLYVSTTTGFGQCFHCGTGFNPHKFVMAREGCSYSQADAIVKGDPNGWIKTPDEPRPLPSQEWPPGVPIADSPVASQYLIDRGIDHKLVAHFGLYFCQHPTVIGDRLFHTEDRVVIPIHDIDGKPVSWQARTVLKAVPKYLFPPAFKGAESLFHAWGIPRAADYLIVCEGVMDVFGWWRHGAKNVVATFGKKISQAQIEIIHKLAPKMIFIAWDSDASWEKRSFAEKYGHLFEIRIVDMAGKDADECSGVELQIALETSKGYSWNDKILHALHH